MYIKQVILQGFKSYKDQTIVGPFSPHNNVVVGRNGSGKSNFFFAIRFVLGDLSGALRAEERQQLLHEGVGLGAMTAYVEIVFDNSDNRIPIERDEVSIRRSIGMKKDEYFLDSKHVPKTDIISLLESSGFSRSNPYYIVQQGKINSLALARDGERLQLLKEVAGTSVYDEKRAQSLKILEETLAKRQRIEEVLGIIEERLSELESEKEELTAYQDLDRTRRSIEHTIYEKERRDVISKLERLEEERMKEAMDLSERSVRLKDISEALVSLETKASDAQTDLESLQREMEGINEARSAAVASRNTVELDLADLDAQLTHALKNKKTLEKELQLVLKTIEKTEAELAQIGPDFEEAAVHEHTLDTDLKNAQQRIQVLSSKQSRGSQFKTRQERDAHLKKEITELTKAKEGKASEIKGLRDAIKKSQKEVENKTEDLAERRTQMSDTRAKLESLGEQEAALNKRKTETADARRDLWQADSGIDKKLGELKDKIQSYTRDLQSTASKDVSEGMNSLKMVQANHNIRGHVYGPLIDLVSCEPQYNTAVEAIAGNTFFNIVVDSHTTATQILHIINSQNLKGRLTFLPLDRLQAAEYTYPESPDVIPMIKKLRFDPKFTVVAKHVFGRTLICRDLNVCSEIVRTHNDMDCITISGDKVNRKGALTGGYIDPKQSKIMLNTSLHNSSSELSSLEKEKSKIQEQVMTLDQQVAQVMGELEITKSEKDRCSTTLATLRRDLVRLEDDIAAAKPQIETNTKLIASLEQKIASDDMKLDAMKQEMTTDLFDPLEPSEQAELLTLTTQVPEIKQKLASACARKSKLVEKKVPLEAELTNFLTKRRQQLTLDLEAATQENAPIEAEMKKETLEALNTKIQTLDAQKATLKKSIAEKNAALNKLNDEIEKHKQAEASFNERSKELEQTNTKTLSKRRMLLQQKDEWMSKIASLGAIPAKAQEYQSFELKALYHKLSDCNVKLKDYSHVNKKAVEQYMSFSEQKENLVKRKEEQDQAEGSIHELIEVLDGKKDEAITRTVKQVAANFKKVFKDLVPHGEGSLVLMRDSENTEKPNEEEESSRRSSKSKKPVAQMDLYSGIAIKVNFTGQGESHLLQQLSGGQKSLVALAFIFAIQMCDPAPFYLFDEIDQALDAAYRRSVAEMVSVHARNAQFIISTFRPEFLEACDQVYGVSFLNKVSHIQVIDKARALEFIEDEGREGAQ